MQIKDTFVFPRFILHYYLTGKNGGVDPVDGDQVYEFSTREQAEQIAELAKVFMEDVAIKDDILSGDWGSRLHYNDLDNSAAPRVYTVTGNIRRPGVGTDAPDILLPQGIIVGQSMKAHREGRISVGGVKPGDVLTYAVVEPATKDSNGFCAVLWADKVVTEPYKGQ